MGLDPDQYEAGVEVIVAVLHAIPISFRVLGGCSNQCFAWFFLVKINDTKIRPFLD